MSNEKLTPQEEELAAKITELCKERLELDLKRGSGVTLEKGGYISERERDIEAELGKLKDGKKS